MYTHLMNYGHLPILAILSLLYLLRKKTARESRGNPFRLMGIGFLCLIPLALLQLTLPKLDIKDFQVLSLTIFLLIYAVVQEIPRFLFLRRRILGHRDIKSIWEGILSSIPLFLGCAWAGIILKCLLPAGFSPVFTQVYSVAFLNTVTCVVYGFFMGLQKATASGSSISIVGLTVVMLQTMFLEVAIYLNDTDLLIFFSAGMGFISLLLLYTSYKWRYDMTAG